MHGNFAMLSRPSDTAHTPFGDIFYSESPDMKFWENTVCYGTCNGWQATKVGAGPIPIETRDAG
jgi:beta-1,4-mannooligosaccharide/beta-1,4-mannosyl-N-acetylglucosamine phosphorylase